MNYSVEKVNNNFLNKFELEKINKKMAVKRQVAFIESMKAKFNQLLAFEIEKLETLKKQDQEVNLVFKTPCDGSIKPYDLKDDLPD